MSDIEDIIQVDDDTRLVVSYDTHAESPRSWQEGISVQSLYSSPRHIDPDPGDNTHGDQIETIFAEADDYELALAKHFHRTGVPFRIVHSEAGKHVWYWEPDAFAAEREHAPDFTGDEYLDGCIREYGQWADGDVYVVTLEKRRHWNAADGSGDTLETWEAVESIGGNYLTAEYTARHVAAYHFDTPLPEGA